MHPFFQNMYTFTAEQIEIEAPFRAVLLGEMQTGKSYFATQMVDHLESFCFAYDRYKGTNIILIRKITLAFNILKFLYCCISCTYIIIIICIIILYYYNVIDLVNAKKQYQI